MPGRARAASRGMSRLPTGPPGRTLRLLPIRKASRGISSRPPAFLEEGQKAAQRSLTFGIISVVLILLMYWIPYSTLGSIILGALGISAARDAERHGVPAKAGRILSWIGVILPIALTVFAIIALLSLLFTLKG